MKSYGEIRGSKPTTELPVLCTQTAPYSNSTFADVDKRWQVQVESNNETVTGYIAHRPYCSPSDPTDWSYRFRDRLTFRFRGVRFAPQPERFSHPKIHNGTGATVSALNYGSECIQVRGGSEDCLFLNIWTPFLPTVSTSSTQKLKPVLFWVFGGGFSENSAADPNFDGGNMASRGDVVMVAVNYRVLAFGFLALKDGVTHGNYGLSDQVLGLDWVRKHIQDYGGDPNHITLVGQSSGGASVRALMASPRTIGKFVGAIPMSVPDGPGIPGYADYLTLDRYEELVIKDFLEVTSCKNASSQVACLRKLDAKVLVGIAANFGNGLVIDGEYLTTPRLNVSQGAKASYRLMTGYTADDATPFLRLTPNITSKDQEEWLTSQGLPNPPRSLFPLPQFKNETLAVWAVGTRTYTDLGYRCMNQATAYAGLMNGVFKEIYFFEFDRSYQTPDWPRLDICDAPRSSDHPLGNSNARFDNFNCHSGQLLYLFGNIRRFGLPYRDEKGDREFERDVLDRWASFVRGEKPDGRSKWEPAVAGKMQTLSLKWPRSTMGGFRELEQCKWLGLSLDSLI